MTSTKKKQAIIIGAGPAGLTAAYELATRTDIEPLVLEKSDLVGGIARTVNYKGNRMDIGGHRFFSKSQRVMTWWLRLMPVESHEHPVRIQYHHREMVVSSSGQRSDPAHTDRVMLVRPRKSRIYFLRRLFSYPIRLDFDTLSKLGVRRAIRIALSYLRAWLFPIADERNLEQFFVNRFGRELYRTFFQSYTEKVWGVPCRQISAAWGAQRIKGVSVSKAVGHFMKTLLRSRRGKDFSQKQTETSFIERFLYPKLGPGHMWETVRCELEAHGGKVLTHNEVNRILLSGGQVVAVETKVLGTEEVVRLAADYVFSTMPVKELIACLGDGVPANVKEVAGGLVYRDFITVGLLLERLKLRDPDNPRDPLIKDNWIYIQEPDVGLGRLQIFNNWSPFLVSDPTKVWVGLEYFCNEEDPLWRSPDPALIDLAKRELHKIGIIDEKDVLDATVVRMEKAYPAYFGSYDRFGEIRDYLDGIPNLFLIGRNGMHRYNNQDHSVLTALLAVDNILSGRTDKSNLWDVNTEEEYVEGEAG